MSEDTTETTKQDESGAAVAAPPATQLSKELAKYMEMEYEQKLGEAHVKQVRDRGNDTVLITTDFRKYVIPNDRLTSTRKAAAVKESRYGFHQRPRKKLIEMAAATGMANPTSAAKSALLAHLDRKKDAQVKHDPLA